MNKIMPKNYSTFVHTEPFVEHHCTPAKFFEIGAFGTSNVGSFFVFGILNAKFLAFSMKC